MPIRRSDTMRAVDAVQPLVDQFNALDDGDKLTFLDLVDPLPDKLTHSHKQKKSSKKAAGSRSGGKSKHASSLQQQISGRAQSVIQPPAAAAIVDDADIVRCIAMIDDNGGEMVCDETQDDNIHHKQTMAGYHEFQPPATHAASGGD